MSLYEPVLLQSEVNYFSPPSSPLPLAVLSSSSLQRQRPDKTFSFAVAEQSPPSSRSRSRIKTTTAATTTATATATNIYRGNNKKRQKVDHSENGIAENKIQSIVHKCKHEHEDDDEAMNTTTNDLTTTDHMFIDIDNVETGSEAVKAEADACLSSSSSSSSSLSSSLSLSSSSSSQQQQQQQPDEVSSSSYATVTELSPSMPPRSRINDTTSIDIDIDRAKKRQKIDFSDENNNNIAEHTNEQVDHILRLFLDYDDDDSTATATATATARSVGDESNESPSVSGDNSATIRSLKGNTYDRKWEEMYQRLVAYKKEHNDTRVPSRYQTDRRLGNWVNNQRRAYISLSITEERIRSLNSIGFVWDWKAPGNSTATWEEMYQRLVAYKKEHKDTNVPRTSKEDPKLGVWVDTQRTAYKTNKISAERIRLLDSVGFGGGFSTKNKSTWENMCQRLVAYKREHNDTSVPFIYKEDPQLGTWVSNQRIAYRAKSITKEHKQVLNSIGFLWNRKVLEASTATWEQMYQRL